MTGRTSFRRHRLAAATLLGTVALVWPGAEVGLAAAPPDGARAPAATSTTLDSHNPQASSTVSTGLSTELSTGSASSVGISPDRAAIIQPITRTNPSTSGTSGTQQTTPSTSGTTNGTTGLPIEVRLTSLVTPSAAAPQLRVTGTVDVGGTVLPTDLGVVLEVGGPLRSRGELAQLTSGGPPPQIRYSALASGPLTISPTATTPGQFAAQADVPAMFRSSAVSVRPVRISVVGRISGRARATVASTTTFMVVSPPQAATRTAVVTVLPISSKPRLRSDGLLTDNTLADEIRDGGRLDALLDPFESALPGAPPPQVTLAVDPTLVQALGRMEKPYKYASPSGERDAPADIDAGAFLDRIKDFARRGGKVIALPYGDADLPALVRADQLDALQYSVNTGQVVIAGLLGGEAPRSGTIAYPAGGIADPRTVDVLSANGAGTVIVDDRLLPAAQSVRYTPSAAVTLPTSSGQVRVLAADHRLAEAVASYDGQELLEQALARFRAELAMITAEPSSERAAVLALPRDFAPPPGWLNAIIRDLDSAYSRPVGIEEPSPDATRQRAGLTYNADAQSRELPVDYVKGVGQIRGEVAVLSAAFCPPTTMTGDLLRQCRLDKVDPMGNTLITALSAWWRTDRLGGFSLAQQADGQVGDYRSKIRVVASRIVNLTSSRGRVPVTLENGADWNVTVVLKLSSTDRGRLVSATEVTRVLEPLQKDQFEIEVDAESAGTFPVDIRLETVDGQALGPDAAARVLVRSTVYGAIATAITIGAIGVLMLAVLIRLLRKLRARSRGGSAADAAGAALPDGAGLLGPAGANGASGAGDPDHPGTGAGPFDPPGTAGPGWPERPVDDPAPAGLGHDPYFDGPPAPATYREPTGSPYGPSTGGPGGRTAEPWPGRPAAPAGSASQPRRRDGR
ncbi:DUF6049 family protein [Frankia sp. Mgl5]|uniref:DUF6049 family protein n=1 Tax=Frankia sp. Mgl5 TaxID=2933793 RepID=UPI00200E6282|nr:DUF6049 family protein [Frankia sp. Mgl5]MCK9930064.1 DUF6049 family protein [Frankia sp. Mgl5]